MGAAPRIRVDPTLPAPIWSQIEESVRHLVASAALRPGEAVPSVRDLARDQRVNPNTVAKAYQRLADEGVLAVRRGEGTFVAWVKRIGARAYLRRLQKERKLGAFASEGLDEETPAPTRGDAEAAIDLDGALKELGAAERLCVSLCFGAGLSHAEAAEALNLPLGTVKSHVKRGLDKLRARLAPGDGVVLEGRRGNG